MSYLARVIVVALLAAAVLRFCYRGFPYREGDVWSYVVVSAILTLCAVASWTTKAPRVVAGGIAAALCVALIKLAEMTGFVVGKPWQYFYADDYIAVFQFIAPIAIGLLSTFLAPISHRSFLHSSSRD